MDEDSIRKTLLSPETKILRRPLADTANLPYTPIYASVLIPGERITFDLYLKVAQQGSQNAAHLLFLQQGEAWERKWPDLLTQKGLDHLYFLNEDLEQVIAYLNNYLQMLNHPNAEVSQKMLTVFSEHLNFSIRLAFRSHHLGPIVQVAQKQVENLILRLQQNPASLKLVWQVLYHSYNLYNHSLNLCLLGTAFMLFLKKPTKECRGLGLAGLLHDVGMTRISQNILLKEGPLTPGERVEINHHPEIGFRLLKETSLSQVPNEVLRLSLEHHENAEGSGYPLGIQLSRQHHLTRIIRLLDTYDSLTVKRPYRGAYKPFEAVKIVQEARTPRGPVYDPATLKSFISFLAY